MKKVLIVTVDFLPFSSSLGACVRMFKLAKYLESKGFEVFIVTTKGLIKNYFGFDKEVKILKKYYVSDPFKQSKDRINQLGKNHKNLFIQRFINIVKFWIKSILIPDARVLLVPKLTKLANEVIESNKIENVIVSSPPHSIQLVGTNLKRNLKDSINLIVDYRDGWNTVGFFKRKFFIPKWISESIEKRVLKYCDKFTYVSKPIQEKITTNLGLDIEHKGLLVMNGFMQSSCPELGEDASSRSKSAPIKIGHFGSLVSSNNSYRNIEPLMNLIKNDSRLRDKLEFNFYGEIIIDNLKTEEYEFIKIHSMLDYCEAQSEMKDMDALMVLHTQLVDCEEVIPGKIFDYIKSGRPIIVFSSPEMEGYKIVDQYNLGFTIDITDTKTLKEGLYDFVERVNQFVFEPSLDINFFNSNVQFSRFLQLLK